MKDSFPITNWSEDDRPREKLMSKGKNSLSDAELVAILIGSGSRSESAVELSKRILNSIDNNLNALGKLSIAQLTTFKGIGEAKAISIVAAMELGRRRGAENKVEYDKVTTSKSVFDIMQPLIGELPHEEFWILYLNNANKVIFKHSISVGGITNTVVDVRLVLKKALETNATAFVICHNHPSGSIVPSMHDKQITQKMKQAAMSIDIKLIDHLIITETEYYSFADQGLLSST